jgi:HEAT repeat protein
MNVFHFTHSHAHSASRFNDCTYKTKITLRPHGPRRALDLVSIVIQTFRGDNERSFSIDPRTDDRRRLGEFVFLLAAKLKYDLLTGIPYDYAGFLHSEQIARLCSSGRTHVPETIYGGLGALWRGGRSPTGQYYHFLQGFLYDPDQLWHLLCYYGRTSGKANNQELVWWLNVSPQDVSFFWEGSTDPITDEALKDLLSRFFPESSRPGKRVWSRFQRILEGSPTATSHHDRQAQVVEPEASLVDEILSYLDKLAAECAQMPHYFPPHLREGSPAKTPFDEIRQTVRFIEDRRSFENWLAQERERLRREGFDPDAWAYSPSRGVPEDESNERGYEASVQPISWDEQAGRRFLRATILGDPGFGKTWFLRHEARRLARQAMDSLTNNRDCLDNIDLPVFIRLSDLVDKDVALEDAVVGLRGQDGSEAFCDYLRGQITSSHGVVLLDAWDEVSELDQRRKLKDRIRAFAQKYPTRILLTSRIVGYDLTQPPLPDGKELELLAFDWHQIEAFVQVWFPDAQQTKQFLSKLRHHPQFKGLARIPLMLRLLCQTCPEGGFPKRRSELYRRCLRGLLLDWHQEDKDKYSRRQYAYVDLLFEALEVAAFELHIRGRQQFRENELRSILESWLSDLHRQRPWHEFFTDNITCTDMIERFKDDGILVSATSGDEGELLFLHLTFQEYLAARALAKRADCIDLASKYLYNPAWNQVLIILGGVLEKPSPYIATLLRKNKEDLLCRPFTMAIQAAVEAGQRQLPIGLFNGIVEAVVSKCLRSQLLWSSIRLAWPVLVYLPGTISYLIKALKDDNWMVRMHAIVALGKYGSERAVLPLLEALQTEKPCLGQAAARALGRIGSEQAVESLVKALDDPDSDVRHSIADALGAIGSECAIDPLLRAYKVGKESDNSDLYCGALSAIGKIGTERCIQLLSEAVRNGTADAMWVLALIGTEKAFETILDELKDSDDPVFRAKAARSLYYARSERVVRALVEALNDPDNAVRRSATDVLGYIGSELAVMPLAGLLNDRDVIIRPNAAVALGEIGSERAVEPLLRALNDCDRWVRYDAAEALGKIGSKLALEPLLTILGDQKAPVRAMAASSLGHIGSEQAVEALGNALKDKADEVRFAAVGALGMIGNKKAEALLLEALHGKDQSVHRAVVGALEEVGSKGKGAEETQIGALKDKDEFVRRLAANELGAIGSERAVLPLSESLKDRNIGVRWCAAQALGRIGSELAILPLLETLKVPDFDFRKVVLLVLRQLASNRPLPLICTMPSDMMSEFNSLTGLLQQLSELIES